MKHHYSKPSVNSHNRTCVCVIHLINVDEMIRGANDMLPEKQILNQSHLIEGATCVWYSMERSPCL